MNIYNEVLAMLKKQNINFDLNCEHLIVCDVVDGTAYFDGHFEEVFVYNEHIKINDKSYEIKENYRTYINNNLIEVYIVR